MPWILSCTSVTGQTNTGSLGPCAVQQNCHCFDFANSRPSARLGWNMVEHSVAVPERVAGGSAFCTAACWFLGDSTRAKKSLQQWSQWHRRTSYQFPETENYWGSCRPPCAAKIDPIPKQGSRAGYLKGRDCPHAKPQMLFSQIRPRWYMMPTAQRLPEARRMRRMIMSGLKFRECGKPNQKP